MRAIPVRYSDGARQILDALPSPRRAALRVRVGELAEVVASDARDRMGLVYVIVRADDAHPTLFAHAAIDRRRMLMEIVSIAMEDAQAEQAAASH